MQRQRAEKEQVPLGDLQGEFQGSKAEAGQAGRAEKQETQQGSSRSLVSLMKEFEFCLVEGGAVGGSLFADKFSAQID